MRRATRIVTPLLAAAAVSILSGCRPKEMQRCVDERGDVVADTLCGEKSPQLLSQQPDGHGGFNYVYVPRYRYYYGGGGGYGFGSRAFGGGFAPEAGHSYGGPGFFGGISRGGFGSWFGGGGE